MAKQTHTSDPAHENHLTGTALTNEVLNALTSHIAVLDSRGFIIAVNEAWKRFAQENACRDKAFYVGTNYLVVCEAAIQHNDDKTAETALSGIRAVLHGEQDTFSLEYPCHSPNEERWFIVRVTAFSREASIRIVVAHENITARKQAEIALGESEQTLRAVLETLPVGVWIMDRKGHIIHGNRTGQQIWAGARYVGPDQFGEYKGWWLTTGQPIAADEWAAARAIQKGETSLDEEIKIECFDGTNKIILNSAIPLYDTQHQINGAIILNQDITARKQAEEELRHAKETIEAANHELQQAVAREQLLARTDGLTGVNNRRYFFELADHEFAVAHRYRRPLSVILFDIDHFKQVNDTFGHQVGDLILRGVAQIVAAHLRKADVLARYGGEEFIVLLPESSGEQALVVAEQMRERIAAQSIDTERGGVSVTISAGIAEVLFQDDTIDRLIQRGDQALYAAKEAGRNRTMLFLAEHS